MDSDITCKKCKRILTPTDFYLRKDGTVNHYMCRACIGARRRAQTPSIITERCESQRSAYAELPEWIERPQPKVCANPNCSRAGEIQPPENFECAKAHEDGLSVCCRFCYAQPKSAEDSKAIAQAKRKSLRQYHRIKSRHYHRQKAEHYKESAKRTRHRRYGVGPTWYEETLAKQGGKCAICNTTEPGGTGRFNIDHDHKCCPIKSRSCGKCIRGLLCSRCNLRLFGLEDSNWITNAFTYLQTFKDIRGI